MATSVQGNGPQTGVVIGYFANGHEAHRAINALVDEGFLPSEIGAAFHTGARGVAGTQSSGTSDVESRPADVGGTLREELGTTLPDVTTQNTRSSGSGASSDSTAVQYAALGGGAGTPFDGAGRPGPISGGSLVNSGLPSELKSELPHDSDLQRQGGGTLSGGSYSGASQVSPVHHHTEAHATGAATANESWTDKLKHIFGGKSSHATQHAGNDDLRAEIKKDAQDFGTGEGELRLNQPKRYSQPAFERSFSSYGAQPEHARDLSHRIGHGGAIVTVHADARASEAERVLEAHGGQVRFAGSNGQNEFGDSYDELEVEVFGTVGRDYPGYFD